MNAEGLYVGIAILRNLFPLKMLIRKTEGLVWIALSQDRNKGRILANTVMNFLIS
jgi:hypothetical protein